MCRQVYKILRKVCWYIVIMVWHTKQLINKEACQILAENFDGDEKDFVEAIIVCSQEEVSDSDVVKDTIDDDTSDAIPVECIDNAANKHVHFIKFRRMMHFLLTAFIFRI